jgi:hypothetical protein
MNKLDIMKQPSVELLLEEMIKFQPGITTLKLWEVTKEWFGKLVSPGMGVEFDQSLMTLRGKYYCTNQQWYPKGHVAPPKVHGERKPDPRQTRMDW